jgi:hypothetical protein
LFRDLREVYESLGSLRIFRNFSNLKEVYEVYESLYMLEIVREFRNL